MIVVCGLAVLIGSVGASAASAVGLTYVDAIAENPFFPEPGENLRPWTAINTGGAVTNDDQWGRRTNFGANSDIFESGLAEDSPMLTQTVSGLTPGNSYDLYVAYWTDEDENWAVHAGTSPTNLTLYSWTGSRGTLPIAGSTQGVAASLAVWDNPPPPTVEGTRFTQRPADPLVMILGYAGTASANGSGQIDVYIDDNPASAFGGGRRSWLDGVAYAPAGTTVAATATLNLSTGELRLDNPTSQNFEIKSYQINSQAADGVLDAVSWTPISSTNPSWSVTSPADPANSPYTNLLSEDGGGTTVTLAANGGSLSFGNVWNASPFNHVLIYLTLADDSLAVLAPHYTGTFLAGDFDGVGGINLADYQILLNHLHTDLSAVATPVERYQRGDINGDGVVNFFDFQAFRQAFIAANGAAAWSQLVGQVPEPASLLILLAAGACLCGFGRRRAGRLVVAVAFCWMVAGTPQPASAVSIAIDIDSTRLSGADAGDPGWLTTQAGFTSWNLTDVATSGTTTVVDGVTFEVFGLAGANQTRLRRLGDGTPNGGGGPFNSLLADFLFNEGDDGRAIGVRISGLPVGTYAMQSWHRDYGVTAPEATQVEIRNQGQAASPSQIVMPGTPWSDLPIEYYLKVTEPGQVKEVIYREASTTNRARLNAFTIDSSLPARLTLEVNTSSGSVTLLNEHGVGIDMNYYEIRSISGSLNVGGWSPLGSGPLGTGWDTVPASNPNLISEVNLQSMSSFNPSASLSLGNAFSVGGVEDLIFFYAGPNDALLRTGLVNYVTSPGLPGDHNGDGTVDAADYVLWRKTGINGEQGYIDWRTNFGRSGGAGAAHADMSAVPEPGAMGLVLLATLAGGMIARRRHYA